MEISKIGGWSVKSVRNGFKKWEIQTYEVSPKGRDIREYIETIREKRGTDAALSEVWKFLEDIAGPPLRVYH